MQTMFAKGAMTTKTRIRMELLMRVIMMMTTMVWQMGLTNVQTHLLVLKSMQQAALWSHGNLRILGFVQINKDLG